MRFEPTIGLETHAELLTASKMFCSCPVVDVTAAPPNSAVCPICAGMPGTLPVINRRAVEYALRVAIALECEIYTTSIFARKNYFYPDLPKGYQISQYEQPLARHGKLTIRTSQGEKVVRIRRVHLEEDTGKSVHVDGEIQSVNVGTEHLKDSANDQIAKQHSSLSTLHSPLSSYSLIDLNRSGVPLLEIVTEPDLHSPEEVSAYARALRDILVYVRVNSGDLQKGVLRVEPNISVRPIGTETLGTRTEVKNLNSFRALERAVEYEINRQMSVLEAGGKVIQETVGWDEARQITFSQRSKEEAHDYRYFPEPDLPPLVLEESWIESIRADLPELPFPRFRRFMEQYGLSDYDADVLTTERATADYFEQAVATAPEVTPKIIANWIIGDLFAILNESGKTLEDAPRPASLAGLLRLLGRDSINQTTAKRVLAEMFVSGRSAEEIVETEGLSQISDRAFIESLVEETLSANPDQVSSFYTGKETVFNWLFGQIMRQAGGKANPQLVQSILRERLVKREP